MTAGARLRDVNLNLLVALDALLRTRNVTRAGEEVSLTQSAMSGELRRLRQMFGDELLVRVGRNSELTPLALELIEPVADILARIERTVEHRVSFDPAEETRHFSVAMSDYAMLQLLQPLLRRTGQEAPGISIEVSPFKDQIPNMLRQGGIDLVVGPPIDLDGLHCQRLFNDRFVCIVSADHPDVGPQLTLEAYEDLPHLTWEGVGRHLAPDETLGSEMATTLAGLLDRTPADGKSRADATMESFVLAPFLVAGTQLVAVVPARLARQFAGATGLRILELPVHLPELEETMYWSDLADSDPAHAWLRETIAEVSQAIA